MIDASKYDRSVTMNCPTCGGTQFEYDPSDLNDKSLMKCISCKSTQTKEDLVEANSEAINEHIKEMGKDVTRDLGAELKKHLERAFSGNKYIKIK